MFDRWGVWDVLPESERRRWSLEPFQGVGPLRFGMRPADVTAALGGITRNPQHHTRAALPQDRYGTVKGECWGLGLTFYYGLDERLRGISVDASKGPQVFADGTALVGRVPSEVEQWIIDRSETREPFSELFYVKLGEPGSASLGVVVCAQRAGDRLLTRPVFLPHEAMHAPTRFLPADAWTSP
ncbi:hypothetical protein [Streptomyces venezuelae]|uniref:hypothetical protein n=1 Tax=Streptomyces venezuelae TaxID=54571 RepID=UPI00123BDF22|nr:hypothetical protein [Streptomyces venezuelae]